MCNRDPVLCMNVMWITQRCGSVSVFTDRHTSDRRSAGYLNKIHSWFLQFVFISQFTAVSEKEEFSHWTKDHCLDSHKISSFSRVAEWFTSLRHSRSIFIPPGQVWDKFNTDNFSFITFVFQIFGNSSPIRRCITYDGEKAPVQNKLRR